MGGLSKKIYTIKKHTADTPEKALLLDSGNLLFKGAIVPQGPTQERLTANAILDVYSTIGYDAVAVGPADLAGGLSFLQESVRNGFPWLSANLINDAGKLLFPPYLKLNVQKHSVVITAITALPQQTIPGVHVQPWEDILPPLFGQIKKEFPESLLVLLSSLSDKENRRIAQQTPSLSLIIGADANRGNVVPALEHTVILTQTARQGKYQGVLDIILGNTREWGKDSKKKLSEKQNALGSVNWQLRRLQKKIQNGVSEKKYAATIQRLEKEKEMLNSAIATLHLEVEEEEKSGNFKDQFTYQFLSLKKNVPNDNPTRLRLEQLNSDIRALNEEKKANRAARAGAVSIVIPQQLVGFNTCSSCHEMQSDFWQTTRHANAYNTLLKKKKQFDLNCLPCHMTIDIPGGKFSSLIAETLLSFPDDLQSVGCESCHGSGKKHIEDPEVVRMIRTPGANVCLTCHNSEHDDDFNYQVKLQKVACPSS